MRKLMSPEFRPHLVDKSAEKLAETAERNFTEGKQWRGIGQEVGQRRGRSKGSQRDVFYLF